MHESGNYFGTEEAVTIANLIPMAVNAHCQTNFPQCCLGHDEFLLREYEQAGGLACIYVFGLEVLPHIRYLKGRQGRKFTL